MIVDMQEMPGVERISSASRNERQIDDTVPGSVVGELLRLYRVRDWFHFLVLPFATFDAQAPLTPTFIAIARGMALTFTILSFGYLLNCVTDRTMDLDARKNRLIFPGFIEPRYSLAILLVASLALAAFSPVPAQISSLLCLTCLYVYSSGPRLKSVPIVGSLVNVGNFAPLLFVGMSYNTQLPEDFAYVVWAFSGLLLQNQLIHEAADQVEDRAGNVHTTWLTLGPRWTALLAAAAALGASGTAAYVVPPERSVVVAMIGAVVFGVTFPLLLATRATRSDYAARLRVTHRWCAVLFGAGLYCAWR